MTCLNWSIFFILLLSLSGCGLSIDHTTVVYGTITDEKGQPVDSILVAIDGVKGFKYETLKQVYSGEDGGYELVVEVPKRFSSINIIIDTSPIETAGSERPFKKLRIEKNGTQTNNCCFAQIGEKTRYDFQLIPK